MILVSLMDLDKDLVLGYWEEFRDHGEKENVLWELESTDIDSYYHSKKNDLRNRRFGLMVGDRLVGMLRISIKVNYPANGMIGYSIRPSERGKGYGKAIVAEALIKCICSGILPVTACVWEKNKVSLHILKGCGFTETGTVYDWIPNPEPRKAIELIFK